MCVCVYSCKHLEPTFVLLQYARTATYDIDYLKKIARVRINCDDMRTTRCTSAKCRGGDSSCTRKQKKSRPRYEYRIITVAQLFDVKREHKRGAYCALRAPHLLTEVDSTMALRNFRRSLGNLKSSFPQRENVEAPTVPRSYKP